MSIRVLVADDQDIVRTGLTMILEAQPGIEVVGEAANGREAVALARRLRPDVCLLDIRMPELDGLEATRQLAGPDVDDPLPVVVITTFDLDDYVYGALKAGARGFLLKDAGPALLTQAIQAAAAGDALIAPNITARLLAAFADTDDARAAAAAARTAHEPRRGAPDPRRPRTDEPRDRRRALPQHQHRQNPPDQPDAQTRRAKPRGAGDVGLRERPHQELRRPPRPPSGEAFRYQPETLRKPGAGDGTRRDQDLVHGSSFRVSSRACSGTCAGASGRAQSRLP